MHFQLRNPATLDGGSTYALYTRLTARMVLTPVYDIRPLLDALTRGDVELRCKDGRSIKAHSQKLSLASNGILRDLLEDVLEGEIYAKRKSTDKEGGGGTSSPGVVPVI